MASRSFTTKWSSMQVDPEYHGNDWNSSTTVRHQEKRGASRRAGSSRGEGETIDYQPYSDPHLRFHSASAASLHRVAGFDAGGTATRAVETANAQRRLDLQRHAYQSVVSHAMNFAALKDPSFLAAAKKPAANEPSPFDVFERAKAKCVALWRELNIDDERRAHFMAQYFQLAAGEEPTADRIDAIHTEIERSLTLRRLEKEIEFAVRVREGFVYRLLALAEASSTMHATEVSEQLKPLVINLRKASLDICNAIAQWRHVLGYDAIFLWRGTSYLLKMAQDLNILATFEGLVRRFPCQIVGNPLLDGSIPNSSKVALRGEEAAERPLMPIRTSLLPPILRPAGQQPDGSVVPPEAMARAIEMLMHEPRRFAEYQRQMKIQTFDLIDSSCYDANLVRGLKDAVFNEQHAALDFPFMNLAGAHHPNDDLTPQQRLQIAAAAAIQRVWRGHCARKAVKLIRKQHRAAVRIQRVQRVINARKEVDGRRRRHLAAAKIQGLARGVATRAAMSKLVALNRVATKIQSWWRRFLAMREGKLRRGVAHAARVIQRWWRGHFARVWVPQMKRRVYTSAAVEIQRVWKGRTLRLRHAADPRAIRSAVKIQTAWRGWLARRRVDQLRRTRGAAETLQRFARNRCSASSPSPLKSTARGATKSRV